MAIKNELLGRVCQRLEEIAINHRSNLKKGDGARIEEIYPTTEGKIYRHFLYRNKVGSFTINQSIDWDPGIILDNITNASVELTPNMSESKLLNQEQQIEFKTYKGISSTRPNLLAPILIPNFDPQCYILGGIALKTDWDKNPDNTDPPGLSAMHCPILIMEDGSLWLGLSIRLHLILAVGWDSISSITSGWELPGLPFDQTVEYRICCNFLWKDGNAFTWYCAPPTETNPLEYPKLGIKPISGWHTKPQKLPEFGDSTASIPIFAPLVPIN